MYCLSRRGNLAIDPGLVPIRDEIMNKMLFLLGLILILMSSKYIINDISNGYACNGYTYH